MPRDSEDPRRESLRGEENINPASGSEPNDMNKTTKSTRSPHLSLIEHYLHLTALTPTTFTNTNTPWHPPGARGIYGGEIIGQSIIAAAHTVPKDLWVHSIHAYFVLAGDANIPITYSVENVRTGKSFATRQVNALQRGKPIFVLMASFQKPVGKERKRVGAVAEWQASMPDVLKPGEILSEQEKIKKGQELIGTIKERLEKNTKSGNKEEIEKDKDLLGRVESAVFRRKVRMERDPFEWKKLPPPEKDNIYEPYSSQKIRFWVRSRTRLTSPSSTSPIPHAHLAALSYFTDNWFIGTVGRVNPSAASKNLSMMVSLDHAIYFHLGEETRVDDFDQDDEGWMLVEMDAPWVGEERGLVTQRIWRGRDGKLVATCVQEGLVRLKEGSVRAGERGEEGIVVARKRESKL